MGACRSSPRPPCHGWLERSGTPGLPTALFRPLVSVTQAPPPSSPSSELPLTLGEVSGVLTLLGTPLLPPEPSVLLQSHLQSRPVTARGTSLKFNTLPHHTVPSMKNGKCLSVTQEMSSEPLDRNSAPPPAVSGLAYLLPSQPFRAPVPIPHPLPGDLPTGKAAPSGP